MWELGGCRAQAAPSSAAASVSWGGLEQAEKDRQSRVGYDFLSLRQEMYTMLPLNWDLTRL